MPKATWPIAKDTCRACAFPNRYIVHYHKLIPEFLSQIDTLETVSDVSEYTFHEANDPIDSGYHSPQPMVPACLDATSNPVSMAPVSTNKVPCPFPKCGTLVDLPCNKNEVLSSVLCKDTGCPNAKFPGQVLPLASTPRVSRENLTNAGSICTPLGKSETFGEPNYPIPCNCIIGPIKEKVLPSPIKFPAQSLTASHPIRVDKYLDSVPWAPTHIQHTSTHDPAITSPDKSLNCPRLVLMARVSLNK